ncbi:unnamed protein product [Phaedon cochleariae]|uniref:MOSC domain-containing protein n=1 Tax=Phaedon cochleariae TaxID=80249 RepID=A0A9P0DPK2_PHACE|nr:unnamed protein product [Phaedon cochleariae]
MTANQIAACTTILAGLVLSVAGVYYFQKRKKKDIVPCTWEEVGKITHLNLYPLKSGHRLELQRAECTEFGLKQTKEDEETLQMRDRGLVVYSEKDHEFRSGRTYPKMTLIDVSVHDENHLAIDAPTMRTLYVEIPTKNGQNQTKIKLHKNEEIPTIDCGNEAALWLSRYILGKDTGLRLGYHDASSRRDITKTHNIALDFYKDLSNSSTGLYADLASTNLINLASITDLSAKLNNCTITVNNFRPNFVVDGPNLKPYEEHDWHWVKIGDVILKNVKDCTRCIFTTVDPESGIRNANMEPFKTLGKYRLSDGPDNLPVMGINLEVIKQGLIFLGDKVSVARRK